MFQEQHKQTRLKQFQSLKGEIPITQRKSTLSYEYKGNQLFLNIQQIV